jgi:hypothetical protein
MVKMKPFLFAAVIIVAMLTSCAAPSPEPVAVQPAPTEYTPSPNQHARTDPHGDGHTNAYSYPTFTPTITFTPTLSPTLDAIQSLIASGDFTPYEGREISIVNVDGVDYIADQHGIKYFKQVDGKWVETDDCERVCHFFGSMYYNKDYPEQVTFGYNPDANHLLPDGSPQKISTADIGVRIEGNPYVVRTNVLGEEADLVYIDAFFPNGAGGLGGKVKMLVDVVPVGYKTNLDVGFQKKSNPSEGFPTGSPYGYWARGRSAQELNVKIEWFKNRVMLPEFFSQ